MYRIDTSNFYISFSIDGKFHRTNGPAMIGESGYKAWLIHGKRHRENGPAVLFPGGIECWYLNGERIEYPYTSNEKG